LTKTDDVLLELSQTVASYTRSIPQFQYKNKTYRLTNNYVALPYMKCDVCGNYPTFEVSVIESDSGETLRIGNNCIDRLTGQSVSERFKNFRKKRNNIIANRKVIEQLSLMIDAHDREEPSFQIADVDVEGLRKMVEQMYNGLNLSTAQQKTVDCYILKKVIA
jgi:hypothetical protein